MVGMQNKLTPTETAELEKLLSRAMEHGQILIAVECGHNGIAVTCHSTDLIDSVCDHEAFVILDLAVKGLKQLWGKYNGAKGGKKKAWNEKKMRKQSAEMSKIITAKTNEAVRRSARRQNDKLTDGSAKTKDV
jgi:hypothetical protein